MICFGYVACRLVVKRTREVRALERDPCVADCRLPQTHMHRAVSFSSHAHRQYVTYMLKPPVICNTHNPSVIHNINKPHRCHHGLIHTQESYHSATDFILHPHEYSTIAVSRIPHIRMSRIVYCNRPVSGGTVMSRVRVVPCHVPLCHLSGSYHSINSRYHS